MSNCRADFQERIMGFRLFQHRAEILLYRWLPHSPFDIISGMLSGFLNRSLTKAKFSEREAAGCAQVVNLRHQKVVMTFCAQLQNGAWSSSES